MSRDKDDAGGFSKITGGLTDLINLLVNLEKSGDLPRRGRREKSGLVVEYSIGRTTADGSRTEPPPTQEPQVKPTRRTARNAAKRNDLELVEPVTDVFEESTETVLLFELPGVSRPDIRYLLDGDILLLEAKTGNRLYRKEVLIASKLTGEPPQLRLHNGILEIRLKKKP
jgi:HSP20 family protein